MTPKHTTTVLEQCLVAPPPGKVFQMSLPLTFCDIIWIGFFPVSSLIFYECSLSKSYFMDICIPKLKNSLSHTLEHFWALAGNLIIPSDSRKPEIRYVDGDSVSLTFAESNCGDFSYLVSNHARNCGKFYPFVPQLPPPSSVASSSIVVPVFALQVTLFPETGFCIGLSFQHALGDASTFHKLMMAWAYLSKLGENATKFAAEFIPSYDRSLVTRDTSEVGEIFLKEIRKNKNLIADLAQGLPTNIDKVRATFVIGQGEVQRLKNFVSNRRPQIQHLSSFTVVCAHVWTCMVKSRNASMEKVDEDEWEKFAFAADCRERLNPPISVNYFGNCLTICRVAAKNRQLTGEEGFLIAAEMIGGAIHTTLYNKEGVFKDAETLFSDLFAEKSKPALGVAGSTRHNFYEVDFGWGKPKKFEFVSIDITEAISLSGCQDSGDLEIGLSLPKQTMDAFTLFFMDGLKAF